MADAFKCDRCGELYSKPEPAISVKGIMLSGICYGNRTWHSDTQDLCPNCARDFLVWWEHSNISAEDQLQKIKDQMRAQAEESAHSVINAVTTLDGKEHDI